MEATPPERLRLADLDRARVLAFLDWLQAERGNSAATRNQRLAVIKSFARYAAVERPEFLGQATEILAVRQKKTPAADMGYLTGGEVKALLAEPGQATRRGLRDTVLLVRALRHRRPRPGDLRPERLRRPRRPPGDGDAARQRLQDQEGPADGPHRPAGCRTTSAAARPTPASAQTQTRCSTGPGTPG